MENLEEICNSQFEKIFILNEKKWPLSPSDTWFKSLFFNDEEFMHMRDQLNDVKSELNSMPLDKWHKHTKFQNPGLCTLN